MSASTLDVRIVPAGMIRLSDDLVAHAAGVDAMIEAGRKRRSTRTPLGMPSACMGAADMTGWTPVSLRLPTIQDANEAGDVLWLRSGIEMLGRVKNTVPVDATHWRPVHDDQTIEPERVHVAHN